MSKWVVDIHGDIEGDYDLIKKYEEPKIGHWIDDELGRKCSCCGSHIDRPMKFKYCFMCGARMIESEEV